MNRNLLSLSEISRNVSIICNRIPSKDNTSSVTQEISTFNKCTATEVNY